MAWSNRRASVSLPPAESALGWKYDVFLSFRGADTRKSFVSHLYHELQQVQGITTFIDDREIEEGTSNSEELPGAIEESHTAIVVLSPGYASSKWCLKELTHILQCMEARKTILPVFYDVDPSAIEPQREWFAEAFRRHEEELINTTTLWKDDLIKVSGISGWHSKNFKSERALIEVIVKCVWSKVPVTLSDSSQKLVGIDFRLEQLRLLLPQDHENVVCFIGITGMGGMGKTTLAKAVIERFSQHFDVSRFLANFRQFPVIDVQKQLLSPILKENTEQLGCDELLGSSFIEKCFRNKKVLLILDNVDQLDQLNKLAGEKQWFGKGSIIIITTRNESLLGQHGIELSYKMEGLNDGEALKLFSLNAFRKDQPEEDFSELSKGFLYYAKGLPLTLKLLGCSLYNEDGNVWKSKLDNLSKIPHPETFDCLKQSYDGLDQMEKMIFLDVACFHRGKHREQVIEILDRTRNISSCCVLRSLIQKALLTLEKRGDSVEMHDLVQAMAWRIVGQESKQPGQRSRLWLLEDISHVFVTNTGTENIEAIALRLPKLEEVDWNCEAFSNMHGLRFLQLHNLLLPQGPKSLPHSLRIIDWSLFPSEFLPPSFQMQFLTELQMPESKLVRLWDGRKVLPNLKVINLRYSHNLTSTPDFTGLLNLERLYLYGCRNLVDIHESIAHLKRLKYLMLSRCESVESLPDEVEMDSLEEFNLEGCSKVKVIPEFKGQMKKLSGLILSGTAIEKIPSSIEVLVGLERLLLRDCKNPLGLPSTICKLGHLKHLRLEGTVTTEPLPVMKNLEALFLDLSGPLPHSAPPRYLSMSALRQFSSLLFLSLAENNLCEGDLPDDIGHCLSSLYWLFLSGNNFVSLPSSIVYLSELQCLALARCRRLQQLPDLPSNPGLQVVVDDCIRLKRLSDPSKLRSKEVNLYDFHFWSINCFGLLADESWTNRIYSYIIKQAARRPGLRRELVTPGSEIPELFSIQKQGNSLHVDLPPQSCSHFLGIAFCVVFEDKETLDPGAYDHFDIKGSSFIKEEIKNNLDVLRLPNKTKKVIRVLSAEASFRVGHLLSEHRSLFYLPRKDCGEEFLFEMYYSGVKRCGVKKCGARLVYEQDLEQFKRAVKVQKRTHEYAFDEAGPSGIGSFDDENLPRAKRLKQH